MVKIAQKIVWLLVAVLFFETWCVEGLVRPLVVPGGSMAMTLLGVHRKVVCQDCGFQFKRGVETQEPVARAVCPNCGYVNNDISGTADVSGDHVLMDKSVFHFRQPRVWEVIAFRDPARSNRVMVKRVVGLPGEVISIKHGDVYVNGKIRRKPLRLQRAMAVLVHDADHSTGHRGLHDTRWVTDRWAADRPDSQWGFANGKFAHPETVADGTSKWLTYCHGRPSGPIAEGHRAAFVEEPVTDLCGYNQTRPRRVEDVHAVGDLMLAMRVVKLFGQGSLSIRAHDGRGEFLISFTVEPPDNTSSTDLPTGQSPVSIEARRDGRPLENCEQPTVMLPYGFDLEVSLFDRCLLVAIDGQVVLEHAYSDEGEAKSTSRPLALGCDGLGLIVEDVRIYRDIYYTDSHNIGPPMAVRGAEDSRSVQLGHDEYYVLGDNSPISSDSRNWSVDPGVPAKLLVGKPLAVHLPVRVVKVAGCQFKVPDIGRIRYIR
ncbi:MAG: signal peptidase I [Pirellulales bacterium]|nr:signal peptidase I [Pirellulales bacterium]